MVLLQPSLTLNLKHLASHGAVISAEQQVRAVLPFSFLPTPACAHDCT